MLQSSAIDLQRPPRPATATGVSAERSGHGAAGSDGLPQGSGGGDEGETARATGGSPDKDPLKNIINEHLASYVDSL